MKMQKIEELLLEFEGIRLKPYLDQYGNLTIGIGRCLDTKGISREEALYLFYNDLDDTMDRLNMYIPWIKNLDPVRYDVIIIMAFQLGVGGLMTFKRTMDLVKNGEYHAASIEMLNSKWAMVDCPKRAGKLSQMMDSGKYPE